MADTMLTDKYLLGSDLTWRGRCQTAGAIAATSVMAESSATPGHTQRATYATDFLNNPATMSGPLAVAVAAAPAITGPQATDNDIMFTVNSLWNAMSGFSAVA